MANIQKLRFKNKLYCISTPYIICKSHPLEPKKYITLPGLELEAGTMITVKFKHGNRAEQITLRARPVIGYGMCVPKNFSSPNSIMHLVYDGTNWIITG